MATDNSGNQPLARTPLSGPDPLIGRVINDRYRIVALIARGGMGKVYRAEQAPLGRQVALKVLNSNYAGDTDPEFHRRFFLEASTTARLTHPNTVSIFDYGRTDDDVYYIAMELLEGKTLHRALREGAPFDVARTLHIARQICRSLREAHGLGVIHRDLKPANVFLVKHGDEPDFVKVLDFGLVKNLDEKGEDLTQTGLFMGSPKYMSPEQIRGERVDGRADIYALGIMMYEMLTGKVPFDRPNSVNILMAHVHEAPPPMRSIHPAGLVPPLFEQIVMRAVAKHPDERFAGMEELLVALKQVTADNGISFSREMSGEFPSMSSGEAVAILRDPLTQSPSSSVPGMAVPVVTQSAPTLTAALPPSQAPSDRRVPMIVAGISIAVLAGVLFLGSRERQQSAAELPASASAPVEAPPEEAEPPRPAVEPNVPPSPAVAPRAEEVVHTVIDMRSTPPGAMVRVADANGQRLEYGPTPVSVEWSGANATRGREVQFQFSLAGYQTFSITRTIRGDELALDAVLAPAPTPPPRERRVYRPAPRRESNSSEAAPLGANHGYKLDPY